MGIQTKSGTHKPGYDPSGGESMVSSSLLVINWAIPFHLFADIGVSSASKIKTACRLPSCTYPSMSEDHVPQSILDSRYPTRLTF